jgi:phosphoglycerate kinase
MKKLSVQDVDLHGRRVLTRVDFNVPMDPNGAITDDTRLRGSISTIQFIVAHGGMPVLMSHLGRPKGQRSEKFSLRPVADRLSELLPSIPIRFADDCIGEPAGKVVHALQPGQVALLENLRFYSEEEKNDDGFARQLSELGDLYVNDAFGTAHRAHASTVGVTRYFDLRVSGLLMDKELENLGALLENPTRPFVAVLGGAKVSGKIEVIENLLDRVDTILVGGGMAFTFFKVHGLEVGNSLVDNDLLETVRGITLKAKRSTTQLLLPQDCVVSSEFGEHGERKEVLVTDIPESWQGLDIGSRTIKLYSQVIESANTIFWNGPMGVFEIPAFAKGTRGIARAMAQATETGARTVVGGGDSVAALAEMDIASRITHISTGGGASLEFLAGKTLPGVEALSDASSMRV